jgi:hypothetical protein
MDVNSGLVRYSFGASAPWQLNYKNKNKGEITLYRNSKEIEKRRKGRTHDDYCEGGYFSWKLTEGDGGAG